MNYNYATNTFENGNYEGMQIPGIAIDFGQLAMSYEITNEFSLSLKRIYRGELLADNDNTVSVPKISVDHLELIWKVKKMSISSGIQNLFDKTYSDNIRINAFGGRYYEAALSRQVYTRLSVYW